MNEFTDSTNDNTLFTENQLFSALKLLPSAAILIDLKGKILFLNDYALTFFGYSFDEFIVLNNISKIFIDKQRIADLMIEINVTKDLVEKKVLVRNCDTSVVCVNLFARLLQLETDYILMQFTELSEKSQTTVIELMNTVQ